MNFRSVKSILLKNKTTISRNSSPYLHRDCRNVLSPSPIVSVVIVARFLPVELSATELPSGRISFLHLVLPFRFLWHLSVQGDPAFLHAQWLDRQLPAHLHLTPSSDATDSWWATAEMLILLVMLLVRSSSILAGSGRRSVVGYLQFRIPRGV
jgi:hypothetical protein